MTPGVRSFLARTVVCALLVATSTDSALATRPRPADSIPTHTDDVWIAVGVAAIGAAVGFAIYFAVRPHNHALTGCSASGSAGLQLLSEGDQQTYALQGEVSAIKPGERVRVSGKKEKKNGGGPQIFIVEKIAKDYGSCTAAPATQ
jgi:hypothetical protein